MRSWIWKGMESLCTQMLMTASRISAVESDASIRRWISDTGAQYWLIEQQVVGPSKPTPPPHCMFRIAHVGRGFVRQKPISLSSSIISHGWLSRQHFVGPSYESPPAHCGHRSGFGASPRVELGPMAWQAVQASVGGGGIVHGAHHCIAAGACSPSAAQYSHGSSEWPALAAATKKQRPTRAPAIKSQ